MKHTRILYSVKPAFDLDKEFEVAINWNPRRKKYCLDIRRGLEKKRFTIKEDVRIDNIMQKAIALCLPTAVEGPIVLDGTCYTFKIGISPGTTFNWVDLPEEWKPLREIIHLLGKIADEFYP